MFTLAISCLTTSAAAAKSLQSCPTLCNPIESSPPGSSVPGILQARILEWVAISFSNAWKWKVKVKSLSRVQLLVTPCTGTYQAPPSMGISRQEYWSGVPLPSLLTTSNLPWFMDLTFLTNQYFVSKSIFLMLILLHSFLISICMKYFFPSLHFQPVYIFNSEVSLW